MQSVSTNLRNTIAVIAIALVSSAATACGSESASSSRDSDTADGGSDPATIEVEAGAAETIRTAAARSGEAPTVKVRMRITIDGKVVSDGTTRSTADGTTATGTFEMPGIGEVAMLAVDDVYYYAYPDLPPGKQWVRIGFDEMAGAFGVDPGAASGQDPTQAFSVLQSVSDAVETIGNEEVAGVTATHYRFTTRVEDLMARAVDIGVLTDRAAELSGLLDGTTEIDVWIGPDDTVRRMSYQMELPAGALGSEQVPMGYDFEFSEYGEPVEVTAPDPDTVMSMSDYAPTPRFTERSATLGD